MKRVRRLWRGRIEGLVKVWWFVVDCRDFDDIPAVCSHDNFEQETLYGAVWICSALGLIRLPTTI